MAAELASTAQGLDTVVSQLASDSWLGPTSAAMVAAVEPYVSWVSTTAGQAEHAATQASSAAAAFETVFASVVPPPLIAANRAELAQAVSANLLGQYNNLISQLEAQYAEFWSQNSSALYSYASSSAAATKITSFTEAPAIANPASALTSAVKSATATPATSIQTYIQGLLTNVQARIQSLTGPFIGNTATSKSALSEIWFLLTGQTILPTNLGTLVNGYAPFASLFYNTEGLPYFSVGMGNFGTQIAKSAGWLGGAAPAAAAAVPKGIGGLGGGRRAGRRRPGSRSPRGGAVGAQLLARSPTGQRDQASVGHPGQRTDHRGRARHRKRPGRLARRRNRRRPAGPARARATDSNQPSWPAPCRPASQADPTPHPEGAPAAHPATARLSGISGATTAGGSCVVRVNGE